MKVKTSITISDKLLFAINKVTPKKFKSRSEFIETAGWSLIKKINREKRNARDLEIINKHADSLNNEASDVLKYQVEW